MQQMLERNSQKTWFIILLCGLPFSHFVFRYKDLWLCQGMYFQVGVLVLFCISIWKNKVQNKPLALLTLWLGLVTSYFWWYVLVRYKQHAILTFLPYFNFICFVIFYKAALWLKKEDIKKILDFMTYSVFVVLCYCVLQVFWFDQFLTPLDNLTKHIQYRLVGTIGNTSHLAGYIALTLPLFYRWNSKLAKPAIYLAWGIILITGSTSGLLTAVIATVFYLIFYRPFRWYDIVLVGGFGLVVFAKKYGFDFGRLLLHYGSLSGRLEFWEYLVDTAKSQQGMAITGKGLGFLNTIAATDPFRTWRHAHCEYLHYWRELGFIGLGLIGYAIVDYFRIFKKSANGVTEVTLASMMVGFLVLSALSYPSHLWLLSSLGMVSYSFMYSIKGDRYGS